MTEDVVVNALMGVGPYVAALLGILIGVALVARRPCERQV